MKKLYLVLIPALLLLAFSVSPALALKCRVNNQTNAYWYVYFVSAKGHGDTIMVWPNSTASKDVVFGVTIKEVNVSRTDPDLGCSNCPTIKKKDGPNLKRCP